MKIDLTKEERQKNDKKRILAALQKREIDDEIIKRIIWKKGEEEKTFQSRKEEVLKQLEAEGKIIIRK